MSVEHTPVEDRVSRYREMAEQTRDVAERVANPELREAYLELADRWRALAESTDRGAMTRVGAELRALRDPGSKAI